METYCISHPLSIISLAVMVMLLQLTAAQSYSSPSYPYEIDGNISSTVKIIIVALIFSMFLITFFSLYIRKCLETSSFENRLSLPLVSNRGSRLKLPQGLDQNILKSFPVFLYSDVQELKIGKEGLECAVCISEFANHEHLRFLPKCHHVFHPDCIDAWLASHTTCPVCRADLTVTETESGHELTRLQIVETRNETGNLNYNPDQEVEKQTTSKFPRSHSTGHSLVSPIENSERYTLRLQEEVIKQIVTLKRLKSCGYVVEGNLEGVGEADCCKGGLDSNPDRLFCRSDRWSFTVTRMPGFTVKTDSTQSSSSAGLQV